jgi:hypothetical protein
VGTTRLRRIWRGFGPWESDTVSYTYDNGRRRSGLSVQAPNASPWAQSYSYDGANRLSTLSSPAGTFTYASMKGAGFILLLIAVLLLAFLGYEHGGGFLTRRHRIGEAIIRNPDLSERGVTQVVYLALISNSLVPSQWRFMPTPQDTTSVVNRNILNSNSASVMMSNIESGAKLIASLEVSNGVASVRLSRPK